MFVFRLPSDDKTLTAVPDTPDEEAVKELLDQVGNFLAEMERHARRSLQGAVHRNRLEVREAAEFSQLFFMRQEGRAHYLAHYVQKRRFLDEAGRFVYY